MKILKDEEVVENFGNPRSYIRSDGTISSEWETQILDFAKLPGDGLVLSWDQKLRVKRFRCHKKLSRLFTEALKIIHGHPELWKTIDSFGGCYQWRAKRKSKGTSLSRHCWAIAIDLDVLDNQMGTSGAMDPRIIEIFSEYGFLWGGNFSGKYKDPMHFEFCDLGLL